MPEGFNSVDDLVVSVTGDLEKFRGSMVDVKGVLDQFASGGATGIGLLDGALGKIGGTAATLLGRFMPMIAAAQAALALYDQFKDKAFSLADTFGVRDDVEQIAKAYDDLANALSTVIPAAAVQAKSALGTAFSGADAGGGILDLPNLLEESARKVKDAMVKLAEEEAHGIRRLTTPEESWSLKTIDKELEWLNEAFQRMQWRIQSDMATGNGESLVGKLLGIDEAKQDLERLIDLVRQIGHTTDLRDAALAKQADLRAQWQGGTSTEFTFLKAADVDSQVRALQLQTAVLGLSASAAAQYTIAQKLMQAALRDGIQLSPELLATINADAKAYGDAVGAMETKKKALRDEEERDRVAERASAAFSQQDRAAASLVRGLDRDVGSMRSRLAGLGNNRAAQIEVEQEEFFQRVQAQGLVLTGQQIEQTKELFRSKLQLAEAIDETTQRLRMFEEIGTSVTRSMSGVFRQWATGAKVDMESIRETARGLLVDLANVIFQRMVLDGITKGITGGLKGITESLFGGFRESGGPVSPGRAYIVGEKRPELFVPDRPGMILPSVPRGAGGGGVSVSINYAIDASGAYPESIADLRRELAAQEQRLPSRIVAVVVDAKERGGL